MRLRQISHMILMREDNMNICYVVENESELNFALKLKESIDPSINFYILVSTDLKSDDEKVIHLYKHSLKHIKVDFDIYHISIFSPIYCTIKRIAKTHKKQLLVSCNNFSANYTLSQQIKKLSTIHSYTYYKLRLGFVSNIIVNSLLGQKRINDMGIDRNLFILPPCYDYFLMMNPVTYSNIDNSLKGNTLIFDTGAFDGLEIVEFIKHLNEIQKNFNVKIIIDTSTTDFASLYSINTNIIYSTKDYNRRNLYKSAKYIYTHVGKMDDFDYLLAIKLKLIVIDEISKLCSQKNDVVDHIKSEDETFLKEEFSFKSHVSRLEEIYGCIKRLYY